MDVYKLLYGEFFYCKDCYFEFTKLGQSIYNIEGCCPSCGGDDLNYLPANHIEKHIERIKSKLEGI